MTCQYVDVVMLANFKEGDSNGDGILRLVEESTEIYFYGRCQDVFHRLVALLVGKWVHMLVICVLFLTGMVRCCLDGVLAVELVGVQ